MSGSSPLGPVMVDLRGTTLDPAERDLLRHPQAGGVILFVRNYESPAQLKALNEEIRRLREPQLLIAVDHEGGRIQRFGAGFTRIPPMAELGRLAQRDAARACKVARATGRVIAEELAAHGVDFSFGPVLDIDFGRSTVIGDRAFSGEPATIAELAGALLSGLGAGGMAAVAKHFPGHGYVEADSHVAAAVDERDLAQIKAADLVPYERLIPLGLAGVMPAHVIYPRVDAQPAGFSEIWLKQILRGQLRFKGMIFSDDLSMQGASIAGGIVARGQAALAAGCDMVLACNNPASAAKLLDEMKAAPLAPPLAELMRARRRRADAASAYSAALQIFHSTFA